MEGIIATVANVVTSSIVVQTVKHADNTIAVSASILIFPIVTDAAVTFTVDVIAAAAAAAITAHTHCIITTTFLSLD